MAQQAKKKRRKKHKGTQGGSISTGPARRPRTREEAKAQARRQSKGKGKGKNQGGVQARGMAAPSWSSSLNRGLFGGVIFLALMLLLFKRSVGEAIGLAAVMTALYVPMGYYLDRFFYRRRLAKEQRERALAKQQNQGRR
ncbi:hypothetical protein BH10ACT11_BH10ACT11_14360 [soil metagenome]